VGLTEKLTERTDPSQRTVWMPAGWTLPKYNPQVPTEPSGIGGVAGPEDEEPWAKQIVSLSQPSVQPWSSSQSDWVVAMYLSRYFSPISSVFEVPLVMEVN